jgi:hypothetical protein
MLKWYQNLLYKLFSVQGMADTASGILLQICDIFVSEMNQVDSEAPLETLA